jgi:DNA polymerase III epsilon subunit-like protein
MKLFFDLETTGLPQQISYDNWYPPEDIDKYDSSRIIEIGIIIVDKGEIIETYNAIIKPDTFTKLDPIITKLTSITDDKINAEGKNIKDILKEIKPLFKKVGIINAYNMNFDKNILLSELYRIHDREFIKVINNLKCECTFKLSKQVLYMGSYKMEYVYKELFKIDPKQDHRAFNDAILCKDVYYKLKKIYKENKKKINS